MFGFGGGFLGGDDVVASYVTDLFNGFNRTTGDSYTGGPTTVLDNTGALVTAPVNRMGITGGRFVDNAWTPFAVDGSPIASSQSVRTRRGVVQKYASTFRGVLNEPARTNKVTCRKHNPTDTSNLTKAGDAASVLSVVDDVSALTAAGLIGVCTNGKVYKLDNSAGAAVASAQSVSTTGNTNPHSALVFVRGGSGRLRINAASGTEFTPFGGYTVVRNENITPSSTTRPIIIEANAGQVIYFILPQLEEGSFGTSVIPGDTLATSVRNASVYSRPSEGRLRPNTQGISVRVFPSAAGQTGVLWSTRVDANNYAQISATPTTLVFSKTVAGVTTSATVNYTHAKDTPFIAMAHQDPVGGMKVRAKQDGGAWTAYGTNASVSDMPIGTGYNTGNLNGASHFSGNFPYVELVQAGLSPFETAIQ